MSREITTDLETSVAARNDEAGHAANAAYFDELNRRRLPGGKIGCLCADDPRNADGRSDQSALYDTHTIPPYLPDMRRPHSGNGRP